MRFTRFTLPVVLLSATLLGCSAEVPDATDSAASQSSDRPKPESTGVGHGAVTGASEVSEPQLALVSVGAGGEASLHDLITGEDVALPDVEPPLSVDSDGRYLFISTEAGLTVLDSGRWTWDHADHFHYYRAEPVLVGTVTGAGVATMSTGMLSTAGGTGVFFPESGEAVLLDNDALSRGQVEEYFRLELPPHDGIIAPLADGALVSVPGSEGVVESLEYRDATGQSVADLQIACPEASGTITTRLALVVGCSDGAVLASQTDGSVELKKLPYPDGAAPAATSFAARKGRPTVAGLGSGAGVWLLDTRNEEWQWVEMPSAPLLAAAADDEADHVVVVDNSGGIQVVLPETGEVVGSTGPLVDTTDLTGVSLTIDSQRTYLHLPQEGVVHEIAHADSARIARTLEPAVESKFVVEVGR